VLRFVFDTMFREFAQTVETRTSHKLDVQRRLHQQRLLDAAETDLFAERRVPLYIPRQRFPCLPRSEVICSG
jgi:hypothetical protein